MEKEEFFLKRIRELANIAYQRDIVTFTDFLNLNEQNILNTQNRKGLGVCVGTFGGWEAAERQVAAFYPQGLSFSWEYPIACLHIRPKNPRFGESLTHRDYLGAILNLGVDRSVVGDILIREKEAWLFCKSSMTEFFMENLSRIRHTETELDEVSDPGELPGPSLEAVNGTCSSVRLDSLIALAFRESRSSMVSYIEKGFVFVNGRLVTSNGFDPKPGDIISVRGKGRFVFDGVSGQTKKGRLSVCIKKYV